MATRYLNAVLGAEQNLRPRVAKEIDAIYKDLAKPALLGGRIGTYEPLDTENGEHLADEFERVQITATEVWGRVRELLVELFDITAARDFTNSDGADAVADVVVGGNTLVADAPAPYLIWLDRQLDFLKNVVDRMPVLPPTAEWALSDPVRGIYESATTRTPRQVQQFRSMIIAEATPQHKAQTHVWQDAVQVGWWTRKIYSGAMEPATKAMMLQRILTLQNAVDAARQAANKVEAKDPKPGEKLLSYVFDAPVGT